MVTWNKGICILSVLLIGYLSEGFTQCSKQFVIALGEADPYNYLSYYPTLAAPAFCPESPNCVDYWTINPGETDGYIRFDDDLDALECYNLYALELQCSDAGVIDAAFTNNSFNFHPIDATGNAFYWHFTLNSSFEYGLIEMKLYKNDYYAFLCSKSTGYDYYKTFSLCKLAPANQFPGDVYSQYGDVVVMPAGGGSANIPFYWQDNEGYCGNITQMRSRMLTKDGVNVGGSWSSWTDISASGSNNYYGYNASVSQTGAYVFEFEIRDSKGNQHSENKTVAVTVVPSCHNPANPSETAMVTVSGTGVEEVVNGGYGHYLGGYKVAQNVTFQVNFGVNTVDFATHYDVFVNDGSGGSAPSTDVVMTNLGGGIYDVRIKKEIGSFAIEPVKKSTLGSYCKTFSPVSLFVGGSNVLIPTQPCIVIIPDDIPEFFPDVNMDEWSQYIFQHFTYAVGSQQGVIVQPGVTLEAGALLFIDDAYAQPDEEKVDNAKLWVQNMSYDDEGTLIAESKQFFDQKGLPSQLQAKNLTSGFVIASQSISDKFGRQTLATLPAPIRSASNTVAQQMCGNDIQIGANLVFLYDNNFVKSGGAPFSFANFDTQTKVGNPDPLDETLPYSLGWYYSSNNTLESHVPSTNSPYRQIVFHEDGSLQQKATVNPGDVYRSTPGFQHIEHSALATQIQSSDMNIERYLNMRSSIFPNQTATQPLNLFSRGYVKEYTDPNGTTFRSYYDQNSRLIIQFENSSSMSFVFYNDKGQVVVSVSPNGVNSFNAGLPYNTIDKITYEYDARGLVLATDEADAGRTEYKYRKDGKVRFSQNEEQRISGKFYYVNYDDIGRLAEYGEYIPGAQGDLFVDITEAMLEDISPDGGLSLGSKIDITKMYYDGENPTPSANIEFHFQRGKVSCTEYVGVSKTWFGYDERGRITNTLQFFQYWDGGTNKTVNYKYNPQGKIKEVAYNMESTTDRFFHVYEYDNDTRLKKVYITSTPPVYEGDELKNGKLQATYHYYIHGPLKRVEIAEKQGLDYTYTAEGWLKTINHPLNSLDPGKDGPNGFDADIFGMQLDYYSGDYTRTSTGISSITNSTIPSLYNGNIRFNTFYTATNGTAPVGYGHLYDAKNQLTEAVWGTPNYTTGAYSSSTNYRVNNLTYDANGNILSLTRKGQTGTTLDNFTYTYEPFSNKLTGVSSYGSFTFNAIGQTLSDNTGGVVKYNQYDSRGLITGLFQDPSFTQQKISFRYDEHGNRITKTDLTNNTITWYVRDIWGRILSVYDNTETPTIIKQTEVPIYGASRIGVYNKQADLIQYELSDYLGNVRATFSFAGPVSLLSQNYNSGSVADYSWSTFANVSNPNTTKDIYNGSLKVTTDKYYGGIEKTVNTVAGKKYKLKVKITPLSHKVYAATLNNNVPLATQIAGLIETENEIELQFTALGSATRLYFGHFGPEDAFYSFYIDDLELTELPAAQIESYADYYPGGMLMPGRNSVGSLGYRFDYQGQFSEKDPETDWNTFALRSFNSKLMRWNTPDPYGQYFSPYLGMGNNPINMIDPNGGYDDDIYYKDGVEVARIKNGEPDRYFNVESDNNGNWVVQNEVWSQPQSLAQSNGGHEGQANWFFGAAASSLEFGSGISRVGSNGTIYAATQSGRVFYGNQFVKTFSLSKTGALLGKASLGLGVLLDTRALYNNEMSPAKYGLNTGMGVYGTWVNPIGGLLYFGVDGFYPGGWEGLGNDQNSLNQENSFNPYWQLWPGAMKQ